MRGYTSRTWLYRRNHCVAWGPDAELSQDQGAGVLFGRWPQERPIGEYGSNTGKGGANHDTLSRMLPLGNWGSVLLGAGWQRNKPASSRSKTGALGHAPTSCCQSQLQALLANTKSPSFQPACMRVQSLQAKFTGASEKSPWVVQCQWWLAGALPVPEVTCLYTRGPVNTWGHMEGNCGHQVVHAFVGSLPSEWVGALELTFLSFFFWLHHVACRILVPWSGIEPMPSAVELRSQLLHHQGSPVAHF